MVGVDWWGQGAEGSRIGYRQIEWSIAGGQWVDSKAGVGDGFRRCCMSVRRSVVSGWLLDLRRNFRDGGG